MAVVPAVRGLYLCEDVFVDPITRNLSLRNCFRAMRVAGIPKGSKPFFVVAYLVGGFGDYTFKTLVSRMDTMEDVYWSRAVVRFSDRIQEIRFKLRIEQCRFPIPGQYEITLWSNNEMFAQTPFTVHALGADVP